MTTTPYREWITHGGRMRLTIASNTTPTCVPRSSSALCRQLDTLLELYIDRGRARSQDGAKTDTVLFSAAVSRYGAVAVAAVVVGARWPYGFTSIDTYM